MQITRTETIAGMLREYRDFAELLKGLDDAEWHTPTRCEGFEVRDVAGHVVGLAEDVVAGVPGSRTAEEEAASVRTEPATSAAKRLEEALVALDALGPALDSDEAWNGPSGLPDLTMGDGVLTLWYDVFVHGDDIRAALGQPSASGPGLRAAVVYLGRELTRRGWGPARITFADAAGTGIDELTIPAGATDAPAHPMTPMELVLAATGRLDADRVGLDETVNIYRD